MADNYNSGQHAISSLTNKGKLKSAFINRIRVTRTCILHFSPCSATLIFALAGIDAYGIPPYLPFPLFLLVINAIVVNVMKLFPQAVLHCYTDILTTLNEHNLA